MKERESVKETRRKTNAAENENSYQEAARLTLALRTLRTILECDIKKTATKSSEKKKKIHSAHRQQ